MGKGRDSHVNFCPGPACPACPVGLSPGPGPDHGDLRDGNGIPTLSRDKRPSLDPNVLFWTFFHFFSLKESVWPSYFFLGDHLNNRWAFFYQFILISRSWKKGLICRTQKTEGQFDPKNFFFWLFYEGTTWKCFLRRKFFFERFG